MSDIAQITPKNFFIMAKLNIECRINNTLSIKLMNVQQVYGHDDSLPYNADVYVCDLEHDLPCFTKVATAWNDGWGGPSCVSAHLPKYNEYLKELDKYLKENFKVDYETISWDLSLEELVEYLACIAVDGGGPTALMTEIAKHK